MQHDVRHPGSLHHRPGRPRRHAAHYVTRGVWRRQATMWLATEMPTLRSTAAEGVGARRPCDWQPRSFTCVQDDTVAGLLHGATSLATDILCWHSGWHHLLDAIVRMTRGEDLRRSGGSAADGGDGRAGMRYGRL